MAVRIYIVDDHASMRRALVDFIEGIPGFQVVGAAETAEKALDELDGRVERDPGAATDDVGTTADLVLVDTRLPRDSRRAAREATPLPRRRSALWATKAAWTNSTG